MAATTFRALWVDTLLAIRREGVETDAPRFALVNNFVAQRDDNLPVLACLMIVRSFG